MQHRKQEKPGTEFPLSNPLGEIFTQNANLWFATHAELLAKGGVYRKLWDDQSHASHRAGQADDDNEDDDDDDDEE